LINRFVTWLLIKRLLVGSLAGLLLCRLIDLTILRNGNHLDQTSIGLFILRGLAIVFGGTAIFLVPLRIFLDRPHVRDMQECVAEGEIDPESLPPFWRHLFYMNYGSVPKWVYMPFMILAIALAGILVLGIIALIVLAGLWVILYFYTRLFGH
jgi:hypothetical protein